jgi:hypothetical protein
MPILHIKGNPDCLDFRQQAMAMHGYLRHNLSVETLPVICAAIASAHQQRLHQGPSVKFVAFLSFFKVV